MADFGEIWSRKSSLNAVDCIWISRKNFFCVEWRNFLLVKVKVKCTLVQALRLCTGCTAHRRSRGIALLFYDHGTRRGWGVSVTPRPLFTPGRDPVPIAQEAGRAPGPVWTGAENLAPPGFDPRTVQPVASRYTDYATRPTCLVKHRGKFVFSVYGSSASTYFRYYIGPNFDSTNLSLFSDVTWVVTGRFQRPAEVVERTSCIQNGANFAWH